MAGPNRDTSYISPLLLDVLNAMEIKIVVVEDIIE